MDTPAECRQLGVAKKTLGEQLDHWCEMLACAAVGLAPRVSTVFGGGPPVGPVHVPRPPDGPRPGKKNTQEDLIQSHLTRLTIPKTESSSKPPSGLKTKSGQVRKKSLKKIPSGSKDEKTQKKTEKVKSNSRGKVRTKSRSQMSNSSNSKPNSSSQTSPVRKNSFEDTKRIPLQQAGFQTLHNSDSDSDSSDSDSEEFSSLKPTFPISSVGLSLRASIQRPICKSLTNLASDDSQQNEISEILPLHSPRTNCTLSKSTSNLTKLPEVISPQTDNSRLSSDKKMKQTSSTEKPVSNTHQTNVKKPKSETQDAVIEKVETPGKAGEKKKKIKPSMISLVKPLNQEIERDKFLNSKNYQYNPQFEYRSPIEHSAHKTKFKPEYKLIPLALRVLENALLKHGTYENFAMNSGGRELTPDQIKDLALKYLKDEGLEDEVCIKLSPDLVSRACMTRVKGRPMLQVQTNNVHEGWMAGLLRHEIGTHYLRSCNNQCQGWRKKKKRKELGMEPQNPTEEGLASLHSVIFREDPSMFRAAMLYYTVAKGSDMSFSALFQDLEKFVKSPDVRWDYCLRAKRGFTDTSVPGSFSKDQVYLKGALEILKHRKFIDFHALLRLGKVSYIDVDRLKPHASLDNTRIPRFMIDLKHYHIKLNEILIKNGLTDDDLNKV